MSNLLINLKKLLLSLLVCRAQDKLWVQLKKSLKQTTFKYYSMWAVVAELVDARVLGTRIFGCGSSSLPDRT